MILKLVRGYEIKYLYICLNSKSKANLRSSSIYETKSFLNMFNDLNHFIRYLTIILKLLRSLFI